MTLLFGPPEVTWHEWLEKHAPEAGWVILDPADPAYGPPARLTRLEKGKPVATVFFGSLVAERAPHVLLAALGKLGAKPGDFVVGFPLRETPLLRQTALLLVEQLRPEHLILAEGTPFAHDRWPLGPEVIAPPKARPALVVDAQRRAQWLRLFERGERHEFPLEAVGWQGLRFGSGRKLNLDGTLWAEVCGETLLTVTVGDWEESAAARALDFAGARRLAAVHPDDFSNLLCALVRDDGEEIGYGRILGVDFEAGLVRVLADAVPPIPPPILRVGSLRVDGDGHEHAELKPWTL